MNIAVTGGNGRLGRVLIAQLTRSGYPVLSLDRSNPEAGPAVESEVQSVQAELQDLPALTAALAGCDAVIHLAAYPGPDGYAPGEVYRNNTLASYNVLAAAAALGIQRVCLASSINALGGIGSSAGRFDYFPVDEQHPTYNADDYSLSKWVMEQQADSFARRAPGMTISSLRFHALPDQPPHPHGELETAAAPSARGLWGWTLMSAAAHACLLAVQAAFTGHEAFFIVAPRTYSAVPSLALARHAYPEVPIRGNLAGHRGFYDCNKAGRLLGWVHPDL